MSDKDKSKKDNKPTTIAAVSTLSTWLMICALLYFFLPDWWSKDLRQTGQSITEDGAIQITAVYPPALSLEDKGDIYITVKNVTTSTITVTVAAEFDPCLVKLDGSNLLEFSALLPGEIQTERVQVNTLGGRIDGSEMVQETFALTFTVTSSPPAYIQPLSLPLQIRHTTVWGKRLPGFRQFLTSVNLSTFTMIVGVVSTVNMAVFSLIMPPLIHLDVKSCLMKPPSPLPPIPERMRVKRKRVHVAQK